MVEISPAPLSASHPPAMVSTIVPREIATPSAEKVTAVTTPTAEVRGVHKGQKEGGTTSREVDMRGRVMSLQVEVRVHGVQEVKGAAGQVRSIIKAVQGEAKVVRHFRENVIQQPTTQ